ncbi:MAG: M3 family metallopeptidase [Bacteroidales bacterium]|nr:M3 family metallopeptidase [Bacteroidales bacterium]
MKRVLLAAALLAAALTSCKMENPLLSESPLEYGAPQFDKIKIEHYMPAFEQAIKDAKAEIDAIVANPDDPTFENTIEAMENGGEKLENVAMIFFNLMEADTNDEMQAIAEKVSPMMTEFSMYVSLNEKLFERVKAVYEARESLGLEPDQMRLLEKRYREFARGGANLSPEDKQTYSKLSEEESLLELSYGKNVLAATNAFTLDLTDEAELEGLPDFVVALGKQTAEEKGNEGWVFDLSYPSYGPFMKYSSRRDLRQKMYMAYNSKALGGEFDNTQIVKDIAGHRIQIANILGYPTWADYELEERMVKTPAEVDAFLNELMEPSLPAARKEVQTVFEYAKGNGFEGECLMPWDFSYWSEKYKAANYNLDDAELKPYFQLENCIDAVFGLATKLYGLQFTPRPDLPGYHKDVKVFDVKDEDGRHLALFYADFFPRASKRGGAWMTEFRGQSFKNGVEKRPFISIVTNFSKPTGDDPSLLTHDELTTFLHEFGHSLHGMMAEGRYGSICGTNVARDFVELPSQIMENWAFEPEFLQSFAKHYQTGEVIPTELIDKIVASRNYLAAYGQVRQLGFGILDMAWHNRKEVPSEDVEAFEKAVYKSSTLMPQVPGTCMTTSFSHIFSGGYSAGYYSYKWAEVLEADAFSLFKEKGIFNREVSGAFRREVLSKGSSDDEAVLYRNFRGHNPEPRALLEKLGIVKKN